MDIVTIVKHVAAAHNASEHLFKAQLATLRKVAQRAVATWEAAPIRGATAEPYIYDRLYSFCKAIKTGEAPALDVDLLPASHPARNENADPWAALTSAEDRLASLAKSAIGGVSRVVLRKQTVVEISAAHQRLVHLYDLNFAGNQYASSATGVVRADLVKATASVHEEMERRGVEIAPQHALYQEALALRSASQTLQKTGSVLQGGDGIWIDLPDLGLLSVALRRPVVDLAKAVEAWSPDGSKYHLPIREPVEAAYTVQLAKADGLLEVGPVTFSAGAITPAFTEVFVSGALDGVLIVGCESVTLRKDLQPYVLTDAAVAAGWMPPDGESALPPSLELDVPPELRYWKAADGEEPKEIRDQLVKSDLLGAGRVALVNGQPRRIVTKVYVSEPFGAEPATFAHALPELTAHDLLAKALGTDVVSSTADGVGPLFILTEDAAAAVTRIMGLDLDKYALSVPDSAEMRKSLQAFGQPFKLGSSPELFVSSHAVSGAEYVYADAAMPSSVAKRSVQLLKSDEQRYVLGVVLEPEVIDAQHDIYSEDEVRKSAHTFMTEYRNAGLQHQTLVNDKVRIVESYLTPADMDLNGQAVKKGTWLMGMVIDDDTIWEAVKSGAITGFSIGGSAVRTDDV